MKDFQSHDHFWKLATTPPTNLGIPHYTKPSHMSFFKILMDMILKLYPTIKRTNRTSDSDSLEYLHSTFFITVNSAVLQNLAGDLAHYEHSRSSCILLCLILAPLP